MRTGRRRIYDEPVTISLKCEGRIHRIMMQLKASDTEVYMRGVIEIMTERAAEITPEALELACQELRRRMKISQETIAMMERVIMDRQIQVEHEERMKKKKEIRFDERGKAYQVVIAE